MMNDRAKTALAGALVLLATTTGTASAAPQDYRFEAVKSTVPASGTATVAVRLVHLPDGRPVSGAILFQPRMEMPMDGMAPMTTSVKAAPPAGDGTYPFVADLAMAGPWLLTVAAKVQGEPATLSGSVRFEAH